MISLSKVYYCSYDFVCLNRPFKGGTVFPVRRYRKLARGLLRQGKISDKPPIVLAEDIGEGPFGIKHRGGGRWVLTNAKGEIVSETATKTAVESKAEELNLAPEPEKEPDPAPELGPESEQDPDTAPEPTSDPAPERDPETEFKLEE